MFIQRRAILYRKLKVIPQRLERRTGRVFVNAIISGIGCAGKLQREHLVLFTRFDLLANSMIARLDLNQE
ncbi:MAG: hypothetical protein ABGX07_19585, partial [Pirellulaceae bacterium]